jgi:hypothetical protein
MAKPFLGIAELVGTIESLALVGFQAVDLSGVLVAWFM